MGCYHSFLTKLSLATRIYIFEVELSGVFFLSSSHGPVELIIISGKDWQVIILNFGLTLVGKNLVNPPFYCILPLIFIRRLESVLLETTRRLYYVLISLSPSCMWREGIPQSSPPNFFSLSCPKIKLR